MVAKLKMPATRSRAVSAFLRDTALIVNPSEPADRPPNDPDDRWITATAVSGEAEVLVSGDRDLLNASDASAVAIVSPREFWDRLR